MIEISIGLRTAVAVISTTGTCLLHRPRETEIGTSSVVAVLALPIVTDVILLRGAHLRLISDPGGAAPVAAMDPMTGEKNFV